MTSVEKSPNMMSTTGRIPVMAAPTAIPVKPASEIGVSSTRSLPNSSTRPLSTLYSVPASATSSPQMKTRESRRISSARASRTASPKVNSRVSCIDVLIHLIDTGIRSRYRKRDSVIDFGLHFCLNLIQPAAIREILFDQQILEQLHRVAFALPHLLFLLRPVVLAIHIADVVTHESIGVANEERRSSSLTHAINDCFGCCVDFLNVLPI